MRNVTRTIKYSAKLAHKQARRQPPIDLVCLHQPLYQNLFPAISAFTPRCLYYHLSQSCHPNIPNSHSSLPIPHVTTSPTNSIHNAALPHPFPCHHHSISPPPGLSPSETRNLLRSRRRWQFSQHQLCTKRYRNTNCDSELGECEDDYCGGDFVYDGYDDGGIYGYNNDQRGCADDGGV